MVDFPIDGDGLIRREAAAQVGVSEKQLLRAAARGELVQVTAGVYAPPPDQSPEALHRLLALGASTSPTCVISHASAAVLHSLSMLDPDLSRLHLTSATTDAGYRRARRHLHPGTLTPDDLTQVAGRWVTGLERTSFDVARTSRRGFAGALAVFDAALRLGASRSVMSEYGGEPRTGVGIARRALAAASPLSENPGESWGRAQMIEAGLRLPRLQHDIFDRRGGFVARSDYDWVDDDGVIRLVGEFDGLVKYLKYSRPGESPADVMRREKEREGRLQDLGIVVVRWTREDLWQRRVVDRLATQMRAVGLRPTPANPTRRDKPDAVSRSGLSRSVGFAAG